MTGWRDRRSPSIPRFRGGYRRRYISRSRSRDIIRRIPPRRQVPETRKKMEISTRKTGSDSASSLTPLYPPKMDESKKSYEPIPPSPISPPSPKTPEDPRKFQKMVKNRGIFPPPFLKSLDHPATLTVDLSNGYLWREANGGLPDSKSINLVFTKKKTPQTCRLLLGPLPPQVGSDKSFKRFIQNLNPNGLVSSVLLTAKVAGIYDPEISRFFPVSISIGCLDFSSFEKAGNFFENWTRVYGVEVDIWGVQNEIAIDYFFKLGEIFFRKSLENGFFGNSLEFNPLSPEESISKFGGGLSKKTKTAIVTARYFFRFLIRQEETFKFSTAHEIETTDVSEKIKIVTVRFLRAATRDALLSAPVVTLRTNTGTEVEISMLPGGKVVTLGLGDIPIEQELLV